MDDDPIVANILKKFLAMDGHTVETALTGQEARDKPVNCNGLRQALSQFSPS